MVREATTRFGQSFGGYAWSIIEPALTIVILGYIFNSHSGKPPLGTSFALFYATGLISYIVFLEIVTQSGNALVQNKPLLALRPVKPLDTIIARFILSVLSLSAAIVVVLTPVLLYVNETVNISWLPFLGGLAGAALFGLGVGSLNAALFAILPTWRNIWSIVQRPLFLISGAFFLVDGLAPDLQRILFWNPLIHSTSMIREGIYAEYKADWVSPAFLFGVSILTFLAGAAGMTAFRNRILEKL